MTDQIVAHEAPPDFPRPARQGIVSGAADKLLLVRTGHGKYGSPRVSDEERDFRWRYCESLANQLADSAQRSKVGKRSDMSEADILDQYLPRLNATGWTSEEESVWILRRVAALLNWPLPESLQNEGARLD